jgi:hypothetical protein
LCWGAEGDILQINLYRKVTSAGGDLSENTHNYKQLIKMPTYKADTVYSYKKGKGGASASNARTTFVVYAKNESDVVEAIKKKHLNPPGIEITIKKLHWK